MEDWQKNLVEILETVADEVEKFFLEISETVDRLTTDSEEFVNQIQRSFTTEIEQFEQFFNELVEPFEIDEIHFENEWPMTDWVEPSPENHPACIGCRHFHGQVYGGNLLVCGMHPYGWDGDNCPDWESHQGHR